MSHFYLLHTKKIPKTLKISLKNGSNIELFAIDDGQPVGWFIDYPKMQYQDDKKYFYYVDFEVDALIHKEMIEWILQELKYGNTVSWLNQWRVDCPENLEAARKEMELQNTMKSKEYLSIKQILQHYKSINYCMIDFCPNFNIEYEFVL